MGKNSFLLKTEDFYSKMEILPKNVDFLLEIEANIFDLKDVFSLLTPLGIEIFVCCKLHVNCIPCFI